MARLTHGLLFVAFLLAESLTAIAQTQDEMHRRGSCIDDWDTLSQEFKRKQAHWQNSKRKPDREDIRFDQEWRQNMLAPFLGRCAGLGFAWPTDEQVSGNNDRLARRLESEKASSESRAEDKDAPQTRR
ncbi:MAG: hypothetical protein WAO95_12775 [Burkholderiales bacterium]